MSAADADPRLPGPVASALLAPRSIALVGVSGEAGSASARPLAFLRAAGYAGRIYPVHRSRAEVHGVRAWPAIEALPEVPEHAFIMTRADAAVAAVQACGRAGVRVATIMAGGFADAGRAGCERQRRLVEAAAVHGIRVLGPSSIGVINVHEQMPLTANAAFAEAGIPAGGLFVASQSGSIVGALVSRGRARGIGFAALVSVGGEADLGLAQILASTLDDPAVRGYALFLETIRRAGELRAFARLAAARGKPVAAYMLGRTPAAAALAQSHTGALTGADDAAEAFLRDCGIARVDTFDALLDAPALLGRVPAAADRPRAPAVGVLTTTGGGAAMVVDRLGLAGIETVAPGPDTHARLARAGVAVEPGRIVDLTLAGTRYDTIAAALEVMRTAPEFDLVLATIGSSARLTPQVSVQPMIDAPAGGTPIAVYVVPDAPEAMQRLHAAGIACFNAPETCADALAAAFARRPPRTATPAVAEVAPGGRSPLDEAQGYARLAQAGIACAPHAVLPIDGPHAHGLAYPLALKVLDAGIAHKSDLGGVVLDVPDEGALAQAAQAIRAAVQGRRPGTRVQRLLAQEMVRGVGEFLLGMRRDRDVGPLVVLGAGGVLTELLQDRSVRIAPVDPAEARAMIAEVRACRVLDGHRGRPPGDVDALADAIVALSRLALDPAIIEAEINPLVVRARGQGVAAVDAVVRLR
ncbi:MAG: acetate--CoA ligase family protein [Gammaproteobacteria bacterium]